MKDWVLPIEHFRSHLGEDGKRFFVGMAHGSMKVELYKPVGHDPQQPHEQDELYFIVSGRGTFCRDGDRRPFAPERRDLRRGRSVAPVRGLLRGFRDLGRLLGTQGRRRPGGASLTGALWTAGQHDDVAHEDEGEADHRRKRPDIAFQHRRQGESDDGIEHRRVAGARGADAREQRHVGGEREDRSEHRAPDYGAEIGERRLDDESLSAGESDRHEDRRAVDHAPHRRRGDGDTVRLVADRDDVAKAEGERAGDAERQAPEARDGEARRREDGLEHRDHAKEADNRRNNEPRARALPQEQCREQHVEDGREGEHDRQEPRRRR